MMPLASSKKPPFVVNNQFKLWMRLVVAMGVSDKNLVPWPLTSNHDLISTISSVSGESRQTVAKRLLDEERSLGINVRRELLEWKIEPYVWSDRLVEFYQTSNAFLYETSVWNRAPMKQQTRLWIRKFLNNWKHGNTLPLKILCFGDGLGFDSTFLAASGFDITYFEVSRECQTFARKVFEGNNLKVRMIDRLEDLEADSLDAILCLDVLEHVPDPPAIVGSFARWLKPGGRLITHSPFWLIDLPYSTHLQSNRKYSGSIELFREHQLQPVGGRILWDPIVLEKTEEFHELSIGMKIGGLLQRRARSKISLLPWLARLFKHRNSPWLRELERLSA